MHKNLELNTEAAGIADELFSQFDLTKIQLHEIAGAEVADCGIDVVGTTMAGRALAEVCMGGLGETAILPDRLHQRPCPKVVTQVSAPTVACLCSQYAGWKIAVDDYFAMGSGPMRAVLRNEPIFEKLGYFEDFDIVVGVLETRQLPTEKVIESMCDDLQIDGEELVLLAAPTASIAGSVQIVARSVETCLHKLFELGFDVNRIHSAMGSAYLPPIPKDDLTAIGRTNDSILYGAEVFLWVDGDDESLDEIGPKVPACSSPDYGQPFQKIFEQYDKDFYKIDPLLFSPAEVTINNLSTGYCKTFGKLDHQVLSQSFFGNDT